MGFGLAEEVLTTRKLLIGQLMTRKCIHGMVGVNTIMRGILTLFGCGEEALEAAFYSRYIAENYIIHYFIHYILFSIIIVICCLCMYIITCNVNIYLYLKRIYGSI